MTITTDLERAFGDYLSPEREADWGRVKAGLRPGSRISGEVVARYVFGIFLDMGGGRPIPSLVPTSFATQAA